MMHEIPESEIAELLKVANKAPVDMDAVADLLKDMWAWSDYVRYDGETLEVATGGWSEHEYVIGRLKRTPFWSAIWERSEQGGLYIFKKEGE